MLRADALYLNPMSPKSLQQQEDLYRQALALEPNNASAMVGLALSLVLLPENFPAGMDEGTKEKKWVEGRDLALKARELDPDNPYVYTVIAFYAQHHGDFAGARHAHEVRVSLQPKNPTAYTNLAFLILVMGEPRRAIELLTQAINLNPKHPIEVTYFLMGYANFMLGDNDAAIEWLRKSLDTNPGWGYGYAYLAMAYALKGEDIKARAAAADLRRVDPNSTLSAYRKEIVLRPDTYKEWFESKLVPAWRKAGLPE
jgi:Flp pilus assembly protein TadD